MIRKWEKFHNPYHFIPANKGGRIDDLCGTAFKDRKLNQVTHDRYIHNAHSGRVICRLTAKTPFFVGDERTKDNAIENSPAEVSNFKIDNKPAIPSTSLRGLISNIAEAASNSALRVLENRYLSRRADYKLESLSAIGMIVVDKDANGKDIRKLRPLCLPHLKWDNNKNAYLLEPQYRTMFKKALLKIYIDGYWKKRINGHDVIPPEMEQKRNTFLELINPDSWSADRKGYWYLKLGGTCNISNNIVTATAPHIKNGRLLGQKADNNCKPISENKYCIKKPNDYIRGILRVLGIADRGKEIPTTKTHEIFIPYPDWMDQEPTFDCEGAAKDFEFLAAERTQEKVELPFHNKGSNRNNEVKKDKDKPETYNITLRDGDIVFFRPDERIPDKVAEVSISSIWRRSAGGTTHDYFHTIDPELLPFNPGRNSISIAEQMFGFVEQDFSKDASKTKGEQTRALASRIRFSHAPFEHWENGKDNGRNYYLNPVTLKILDSPKPPSPALYFKNNNGSGIYIPKQNLSTNKHHPQGRKFYLHHADKEKKSWASDPPWETKSEAHYKQKAKITPVKEGAVFYFHIDFANLSDIELGLLLYSLNPSASFHHKIGMGKPIGLGTVKIEPIGLFTINRKERYFVRDNEDIFALNRKRYHNEWLDNSGGDIEILKKLYPEEIDDTRSLLNPINFNSLRQKFVDRMDKDVLQKAIELLGDPDKVKIPVHYPQRMCEDIENENFKWFMNNDDRNNLNKQSLKPGELTELS